MKKLEKKIIQNVYFYEIKQTLTQLVLRILAIVGFTLGGIFLVIFVVRQLVEQQTLDIFEIFFEDVEIIRENMGEVIATFLQELPKLEMFLAAVAIILSVFTLLKFIQNFIKVKNKINSIIKFWFAR